MDETELDRARRALAKIGGPKAEVALRRSLREERETLVLEAVRAALGVTAPGSGTAATKDKGRSPRAAAPR